MDESSSRNRYGRVTVEERIRHEKSSTVRCGVHETGTEGWGHVRIRKKEKVDRYCGGWVNLIV